MKHYDITVHFQVEAFSENAAIELVQAQIDQDDLLLDRVQITSVEELAEHIDTAKEVPDVE